jgi:hypothetical protein
MRKKMIYFLVILALLALPGAALAKGGAPLVAYLIGANEVPNPGDPDGTGFARVTLNPGQGEVCWEISYANIDPATAAHIHIGAAGVPGGVVVPLNPNEPGCVSASQELIKDIIQNPENYYVNVHNVEFPGGAIRGQLTRPGLIK